MPIALDPFDSSRNFVAQTNFRAGGVIWLRKEPFDKSFVNDRVLRQLYDARKIAYEAAPSRKARPVVQTGDQSPEEQHEAIIEQDQSTTEAETSVDAEGGEPLPTAPEAAAAPDGGAETAAAAAAEPLDHDQDGEKGGSLPDNDGDRETLIKRLVNRHTHEELFAKASGLKGVTKSQPKAEIAAALVDAGRVGDGTA